MHSTLLRAGCKSQREAFMVSCDGLIHSQDISTPRPTVRPQRTTPYLRTIPLPHAVQQPVQVAHLADTAEGDRRGRRRLSF